MPLVAVCVLHLCVGKWVQRVGIEESESDSPHIGLENYVRLQNRSRIMHTAHSHTQGSATDLPAAAVLFEGKFPHTENA